MRWRLAMNTELIEVMTLQALEKRIEFSCCGGGGDPSGGGPQPPIGGGSCDEIECLPD
jgi:hypothetical protein